MMTLSFITQLYRPTVLTTLTRFSTCRLSSSSTSPFTACFSTARTTFAPSYRRQDHLQFSRLSSSSNTEPTMKTLLSPQSAQEKLNDPSAPVVYLDVRTVDEFKAGHPVGAVNVPVMKVIGQVSADFVQDVKEAISTDSKPTLLVACKSGKRSTMAINLLSQDAEFKDAHFFELDGGFDNWASSNLPIEK